MSVILDSESKLTDRESKHTISEQKIESKKSFPNIRQSESIVNKNEQNNEEFQSKLTDRESKHILSEQKIESKKSFPNIHDSESIIKKNEQSDGEFKLDLETENLEEKVIFLSQDQLQSDIQTADKVSVETPTRRRSSTEQKRVRLSLENKSITPGEDVDLTKQTITEEPATIFSNKSVSLEGLGLAKEVSLVFDLEEDKSLTMRTTSNSKVPSFTLIETDQESLGMASMTTIQTQNYFEEKNEAEIYIEPEIDRNMYYEKFRIFFERRKNAKLKNDYFQYRMANYYKQRKIYYVFKPNTPLHESIYDRELNYYEETYDKCNREKTDLLEEIRVLTAKRNAKKEELNKLIDSVEHKFQDYGYGLTSAKTETIYIKKITDRYVRIYNNLMNTLGRMRLIYIKLKNVYNETEQQIKDMDNLGPGFRIMDYVQLKADNRILQDRLEEKETELIQLRTSCQNILQVVAHFREKLSLVEMDVKKLSLESEDKEAEYTELRQQMNFLKRERDIMRASTVQLKCENGLLMFPQSVRDMFKTMKEIDSVREETETARNRCIELKTKIDIIRKFIENSIRKKNKSRKLSKTS